VKAGQVRVKIDARAYQAILISEGVAGAGGERARSAESVDVPRTRGKRGDRKFERRIAVPRARSGGHAAHRGELMNRPDKPILLGRRHVAKRGRMQSWPRPILARYLR